jgi:putative protease
MVKKYVKIGEVIHFYTNIEVSVIELVDKINVGDTIMIKGATTEFTQPVESIQIEHKMVDGAEPGDSIGLLVRYRVRKGDEVFREEK